MKNDFWSFWNPAFCCRWNYRSCDCCVCVRERDKWRGRCCICVCAANFPGCSDGAPLVVGQCIWALLSVPPLPLPPFQARRASTCPVSPAKPSFQRHRDGVAGNARGQRLLDDRSGKRWATSSSQTTTPTLCICRRVTSVKSTIDSYIGPW